MSRFTIHLSIYTPLDVPENYHTSTHLCCGANNYCCGANNYAAVFYVLLYAQDIEEVTCEHCLASDVYRNFILELELTR